MLPLQSLALALAMAPYLASAAIFPKDSLVQMLDAKGFKKAMKANQTSLVAFVAPWCGHCQRMVPEYSKAALGLHPLIPTYAVDCDDSKNKRLCADQGVQGFPTVKLFPRGKTLPPMTYESGERTASGFWYFATRRVPNAVTKMYHVHEIPNWVEKTKDNNALLLLTKEKKLPLLWMVLANKYKGQLELGSHRDRKGKSSVQMGYEAGEKKESKVLVYPAGSTTPIRYKGINKLDSLSKFFDSILDGTADLQVINEQAASEEFVPDEKELEIEKQQEAQRIALAHGGFTDLIDFEKAMKNGAGANYHDVNGYPGMMGGGPAGHPKVAPETPAASASEAAENQHSATPVPEPKKQASGEQVVFETPAKESQTSATGQCAPPAETGKIVDPPTEECNPPSGHPKDEL